MGKLTARRAVLPPRRARLDARPGEEIGMNLCVAGAALLSLVAFCVHTFIGASLSFGRCSPPTTSRRPPYGKSDSV